MRRTVGECVRVQRHRLFHVALLQRRVALPPQLRPPPHKQSATRVRAHMPHANRPTPAAGLYRHATQNAKGSMSGFHGGVGFKGQDTSITRTAFAALSPPTHMRSTSSPMRAAVATCRITRPATHRPSFPPWSGPSGVASTDVRSQRSTRHTSRSVLRPPRWSSKQALATAVTTVRFFPARPRTILNPTRGPRRQWGNKESTIRVVPSGRNTTLGPEPQLPRQPPTCTSTALGSTTCRKNPTTSRAPCLRHVVCVHTRTTSLLLWVPPSAITTGGIFRGGL